MGRMKDLAIEEMNGDSSFCRGCLRELNTTVWDGKCQKCEFHKIPLSEEAQEYMRAFLKDYELVEECVEGASDAVGNEILRWIDE